LHDHLIVISSKPEDENITLARLKLVGSAQIVMLRALELMGISAREEM
jgi:arginyl-tRNA synthetase